MNRRLAACLALSAAALVSACASSGTGSSGPVVYNADDFAWAARSGNGAITARVDYHDGGLTYTCAGRVGLAPETGYTRARFQALYGSTERAAVPAAEVRARTVEPASAEYSNALREAQCDSQGRFGFADLPPGSWYVIAPVTAAGSDGPVVLMQRVSTRDGRTTQVVLD